MIFVYSATLIKTPLHGIVTNASETEVILFSQYIHCKKSFCYFNHSFGHLS